MASIQIGDRISLKQAKEAWYSNYGSNPERIVTPDEVGVVTAVNVPVVRKCGKRNSYHVASFNGSQVDFSVSEVNLLSNCADCGHSASDHISGPCEFVMWIGGHPEYRCMCGAFKTQA